jgi:hypothetical protein
MPAETALSEVHNDTIEQNLLIKSGSVADVIEKLENRQEVRVVLEHDYPYGESNNFVGVFYPSIVTSQNANSGNAKYLRLDFSVNMLPAEYNFLHLCIAYVDDGSLEWAFIQES